MIAIYGKNLQEKNVVFVQEIFDSLHKANLPYTVEKNYATFIQTNFSLKFNNQTFAHFGEIMDSLDMIFTLGGDGTILETVTLLNGLEIPILGFNFGRLGFLANVGKDQIQQAIEVISRGKYLLEKRSLLELSANFPLFKNFPFALNEMTIQRKDQSSMITIHTYINGELLNSYWADGLIISTPSGSTGYSLSCGGPIIYPSSNNFVITPVAPHNLNVRPIVVADNVVLSFEVTGRADSFLCTLDSRFETIDSSFQLAIKKAPFGVKLVRLSDMNFISALKNKLYWGLDQRN